MIRLENFKRILITASVLGIAVFLAYFIPRWRISYGPATPPQDHPLVGSTLAELSELTIRETRVDNLNHATGKGDEPLMTFFADEEFAYHGELETDNQQWGNFKVKEWTRARHPVIKQKRLEELNQSQSMTLMLRFTHRDLDPIKERFGTFDDTPKQFDGGSTCQFKARMRAPKRPGDYDLRLVIYARPWGTDPFLTDEEDVLWHARVRVVAQP